MDTSGLASGLSLVAFLAVFAYLCLVEHNVSTAGSPVRLSQNSVRLRFTFGSLRLASIVAVVLSVQALLRAYASPGPGLVAIVGLGVLAFLVLIDRLAMILNTNHPRIVSRLTPPLYNLLSPLLKTSNIRDTATVDSGLVNGREYIGQTPDLSDGGTLLFTEQEQAGLDARERLMIRSIIRLDESTAREIMVPRVDIIAVDSGTVLTEVASRMLECGHSRIPVYTRTIDHIIGVVYSRDLLPFLSKKGSHSSLDKVIRPAYFIPESKRLDELLKDLQEKRVHMAIVVDEYGGVEGLLTLEDLLEEIVGEIEDEFSRSHEPSVVPMANGDVMMDASVSVDYLSDLFSTPIDIEDVDTVGGLVYSALGKMPQVGDEVVHKGLRIEVVSLLGRRIRKLRLSRTTIQEDE